MKILFIFNEISDLDVLNDKLLNSESEVHLFPLSGNSTLINNTLSRLREKPVKSIDIIDTVNAIHSQVDYLRDRICKWSAEIGDFIINRRKIKEWFLLPGNEVSTWWFGLLSEKNTAKTDTFLLTAQLRAIKKELDSHEYDNIIVSVTNNHLVCSIKELARKQNVRLKIFRVSSGRNLRDIFRSSVKLNLVYEIASAIMILLRTAYHSILVRWVLGPLEKRVPDKKSLMFVSYFPAVDKEAAMTGRFRNNYAVSIQDKCNEMGLPIMWVMMYVPIYGYGYKEAAHLASLFVKNREKMIFIEEFLNPATFIKCFYLWLRQIFLSFYLSRKAEESLLSEPFIKESRLIINSLWHRSFCGSTSMEGILYYNMYRNLFERITEICGCLYYCEMHAWEKALNAAKRNLLPVQ